MNLIRNFPRPPRTPKDKYSQSLLALGPNDCLTLSGRKEQCACLMAAKRLNIRVETHKVVGLGVGVWRIFQELEKGPSS